MCQDGWNEDPSLIIRYDHPLIEDPKGKSHDRYFLLILIKQSPLSLILFVIDDLNPGLKLSIGIFRVIVILIGPARALERDIIVKRQGDALMPLEEMRGELLVLFLVAGVRLVVAQPDGF